MVDAIQIAHLMGCNPGGQVAGFGPFPPGSIPNEWCFRLLNLDEIENIPAPHQQQAG